MPHLSIIVPTLDEVDNIHPLVGLVERALEGVDWELIFVDDDSNDGTADVVRALAQANSRVRVVQRIGRRGLASACMEGMLASSAPYLAVLDADLQHDESLLRPMLQLIEEKQLDVVVGSRNIAGGSMGDFAQRRRALSNWGKRLSRAVCGCDVEDPMSGFFMVERSFLHGCIRRMSGIGFKILVDLLASSPRPPRLLEVPYRFRNRVYGRSKLDVSTLFDFAMLLADKAVGDYVPARFLLFAAAGCLGLLLHLALLGVLYLKGGMRFPAAQAVAAFAAMTLNFCLNNWITFRDRRLTGWSLLGGYISFCLACSIGALANISLASGALERGLPWLMAGLFGTLVGAVWNYGVTSVFTWRRRVIHASLLAGDDKVRL